MKSTKLILWGGLASVLAGVLWIVISLSRAPDRLLESDGPTFIPLTLYLVGLAGLYAGWQGEVKLVGKAGFILTLPGCVIAIIANIIRLFSSDPGSPSFAPIMQLGGIALLGIGMTLLGVAALKAKALPRWSLTPLVTGLLGIMIVPFTLLSSSALILSLNYVVLALFGAGWVALGYALWSAPFAWVEKRMDQVATWLNGLAFFDVLGTLGKITVLSAAILWIVQADDRERQQYHEAWQVITSAQGLEGAGGRIEALQTLSRGGQRLEGVIAEDALLSGVALEEKSDLDNARFAESNLSNAVLQRVSLKNADFENAKLSRAQLDGADLTGAVLQETNLSNAELPDATLAGANLQGAILQGANLQGANLTNAELSNADLTDARLEGANLKGVKLHNTSLYSADLSKANLTAAELENADLEGAVLDGALLENAMLNTDGLPGAKLDGADFRGAWLDGTDLRYKTDLRGVVHLTEGQIWSAKGDETTLLPEGIKRPPKWKTTTNNMPDWGQLTEGEYFTEEFMPEFSFSPGKSWEVRYSEVRNAIGIQNENVGEISVFNVDEVYNHEKPNSEEVVEAPEDVAGMVKWFQDHPYLDTTEAAPASIGDLSGVQFDITATNVPQGYPADCKDPCLLLFPLADGGKYRISEIPLEAGGGLRIIVLDVGGEVVVFSVGLSNATAVRSVLESINWTGAAMPILPGNYRTAIFEPVLTYEVGEGWQNAYEVPNTFEISREGSSWLRFHIARKIYDPEKLKAGAISEAPGAPESMVEWFQDHPYLQAGEPESVEVGGVAGKAFDVTVSSVPIDYQDYQCETACVGLFRDSYGNPISLFAGDRARVIVLDVEGKTVSVIISSPEEKFEKFLAEAKGVLGSVEWIEPLKTLPAGYYTTSPFEPPASFELPGGWQDWYFQVDVFTIWKEDRSFLDFHNAQEVYDRESLSLSDYAPAPEDPEGMVEWFQDHPYLQAGEPEPVEVGGVAGKAFDVTIAPELLSYPQDYCGAPCVPLFRGSDEQPFFLFDGDRHRVIVLDVNGETVTITIGSKEDRFEGFLAETQKVLDSVELLKEYSSPGEYSTEQFEPSFTFRVDEDWWEIQQIPDQFSIEPEVGNEKFPSLNFVNVREVYDPADPNFEKVSPAPEGVEGMVAWLREHPHLNVGEPEPVKVGGVPGVRVDVSISSVPENYPPECFAPCVPLLLSSDGEPFLVFKDFGAQFIVLNVEGETVIVTIESPEDMFDEFLPRAEEVLSTLKWGG